MVFALLPEASYAEGYNLSVTFTTLFVRFVRDDSLVTVRTPAEKQTAVAPPLLFALPLADAGQPSSSVRDDGCNVQRNTSKCSCPEGWYC